MSELVFGLIIFTVLINKFRDLMKFKIEVKFKQYTLIFNFLILFINFPFLFKQII